LRSPLRLLASWRQVSETQGGLCARSRCVQLARPTGRGERSSQWSRRRGYSTRRLGSSTGLAGSDWCRKVMNSSRVWWRLECLEVIRMPSREFGRARTAVCICIYASKECIRISLSLLEGAFIATIVGGPSHANILGPILEPT